MIFTAIATVLAGGLSTWFYMRYNSEEHPYSNAELSVMAMAAKNENQDFLRRRKLVVTPEEIREIDPHFQPPLIPTRGEPDI